MPNGGNSVSWRAGVLFVSLDLWRLIGLSDDGLFIVGTPVQAKNLANWRYNVWVLGRQSSAALSAYYIKASACSQFRSCASGRGDKDTCESCTLASQRARVLNFTSL